MSGQPLIVKFGTTDGTRLLISTTFSGLESALTNLQHFASGFAGYQIDRVTLNLKSTVSNAVKESDATFYCDYQNNAGKVFLFLVENMSVTFSGDNEEKFCDYHLSADVEPLIEARHLSKENCLSVSDTGTFSIQNKDLQIIVPGKNKDTGDIFPLMENRCSLLKMPECLLLASFQHAEQWKIQIGVIPLHLAYGSSDWLFPRTYTDKQV